MNADLWLHIEPATMETMVTYETSTEVTIQSVLSDPGSSVESVAAVFTCCVRPLSTCNDCSTPCDDANFGSSLRRKAQQSVHGSRACAKVGSAWREDNLDYKKEWYPANPGSWLQC